MWEFVKRHPRIAILIMAGIVAIITIVPVQTRTQEFEFKGINDHCSGPQDVKWIVSANDGWKIDTSTIDPQVLSSSKKSNFEGVTQANKNFFILEGRLVNHGDCIGPIRDARGSLVVAGSYKEYRTLTFILSL